MSKLREIFESIKATLHWGPSVEPFHQAVISAHEELEKASAFLEERLSAVEKRLEVCFPSRSKEPPSYISPPTPISIDDRTENAAIAAVSAPVPDDADSLVANEGQGASAVEPNPAEPGIKPDSVSSTAQPEPVSAGPDASAPAAPDVLAATDDGVDHVTV